MDLRDEIVDAKATLRSATERMSSLADGGQNVPDSVATLLRDEIGRVNAALKLMTETTDSQTNDSDLSDSLVALQDVVRNIAWILCIGMGIVAPRCGVDSDIDCLALLCTVAGVGNRQYQHTIGE